MSSSAPRIYTAKIRHYIKCCVCMRPFVERAYAGPIVSVFAMFLFTSAKSWHKTRQTHGRIASAGRMAQCVCMCVCDKYHLHIVWSCTNIHTESKAYDLSIHRHIVLFLHPQCLCQQGAYLPAFSLLQKIIFLIENQIYSQGICAARTRTATKFPTCFTFICDPIRWISISSMANRICVFAGCVYKYVQVGKFPSMSKVFDVRVRVKVQSVYHCKQNQIRHFRPRQKDSGTGRNFRGKGCCSRMIDAKTFAGPLACNWSDLNCPIACTFFLSKLSRIVTTSAWLFSHRRWGL